MTVQPEQTTTLLPLNIPGIQSIQWLDVDFPTEPFIVSERHEDGEVTGMHADRDALPAAWADRLDWVLGHPDEARCGLADLMDEATGTLCSNLIGFWLFEDDDAPHRSGMRWNSFALVGVPLMAGGVVTEVGCVAVCADCTPAMLYESANAAQSGGIPADQGGA